MLPPPPCIPAPPPCGPSSPAACPGAAGVSSSAWVQVLQEVGWPTDAVVLDFETYFDNAGYSLSKLSTIEYIEDSRYEELGLAALLIPGDRPFTPRQATFWWDAADHLAWLQRQYGVNLEGCTVIAHNARFDCTILARKHNIIPPHVVDTLALSRHLDARNKHDLKTLCQRWGLPPKGDTMQFSGLHRADLTPEQADDLATYARNDAEREMDLLAVLLPKLTRPGVELRLQAHTVRLFTEPELAFDFTLAAELAVKMEAQVAKDIEPTGRTAAEVSGNKSFNALLTEALAETDEMLPMKQGKRKLIPALAKDDSAVAELKRHRNPRVRELIKARQAVKSWPLHQKRLRSMIAQAKAAGGRLCNPLSYYGAHTGRWSGGENINTANLPTRGSGLQTEMKHCLTAPPGMVLILADAAQIEARGTGWISGQADLCEAFACNADVYSDFAGEVLAVHVRKPRQDDPPAVARLHGGRRALGKVGILGMGYGMGAERALDYMETYPELRPKVESGEIDLPFCKRFVNAYRNKYRMIPKFWRDIENVFRFVTRYGKPQSLRGLQLSRQGTTVVLTLPSGRSLFYANAAVAGEGRLHYRWGDLWGGTLTENVVQAMSRDLLAEALLFCEDQGVRIGHHVYDSLVAIVPEDRAEAAKKIVEQSLLRVPEWAQGWPMGVESSIGKRYE